MKLSFRVHDLLLKKHFLVAVVKLLDHAVSPGFGNWNKPGLDAVTQAKSDEWAHAPGMFPAAKETQGVIDLDVFWHSHALPDIPKSVNHRLTGFG